jgi:glycosyltransferase involved in cell wall biosynthesis
MPKVLFLTPLPPPIHGMSYLNDLLLKSLAMRFDFVTVKLNSSDAINNIGRFGLGKLRYFFEIRRQIRSHLKATSFDLIYFAVASSEWGLYRDMLLLLTIRRNTKSNLLLHIRGRDFVDHKGNPVVTLFLKKTFSGTFVIQHSEKLRQDIDWFAATYKKRYYLPNGIPVASPPIGDSKRGSSCLNLLYLSMKFRDKGIYELLNALIILRNNNVSFRLDFIGDYASVEEEKKVKTMIDENKLNDCINDQAAAYGTEKDLLYRNADIFVFPTRRESFGNVILEAMSYMVPVIASDEGSIPEILDNGNAGLLFQKQNPTDLAQKLTYLVGSEERRKEIGQNGYRRFLSMYTFSHFENNLAAIFNDVADSK